MAMSAELGQNLQPFLDNVDVSIWVKEFSSRTINLQKQNKNKSYKHLKRFLQISKRPPLPGPKSII